MSYLPRKEADLIDWGENFTAQIATNAAAWEIPQGEVTELQNAFGDFKQKHQESHSPGRNKILTAEKDAAKERFVALVQQQVNFRLKNPVITPAQRSALGLEPADTTPSGPPSCTSRPDFTIKLRDIRELELRIIDAETRSKARPFWSNGAMVRYAFLSKPPQSVEDLTRSRLATHTPYILPFTER